MGRQTRRGLEFNCKGCGETFVASHGNQKFCLPACRLSYYEAKLVNRYRTDPHFRSDLLKASSDKSPKQNEALRISVPCSVCGGEFMSWHKSALVCSQECRGKATKARRQRWHSRLDVKLGSRIRCGLRRSLREGKAGRSWESLVGYSLADLIVHLERQFLPNMGWHNMGEWHIDHIVPLYEFDATDVRRSWALTNLRPLWARDNLAKNKTRVSLL